VSFSRCPWVFRAEPPDRRSIIAARPSYDELLAEVSRLRRENEGLAAKVEAQEKRIAELEGLVEQLSRETKAQAAPFSKGGRNPNPKGPGRKRYKDYGTHACRRLPDRV
jgi:hypothetical protein